MAQFVRHAPEAEVVRVNPFVEASESCSCTRTVGKHTTAYRTCKLMVLWFLVHLRQAHDFAFAVNERVVNDSQFFGILQLYTLRISLRHNHVQTLRDEVEVVARTIG